MNKYKVCINRSVVNKANPEDKKAMHNFTTLWEREELTDKEILKVVSKDGHAFCTGFLEQGPNGYCYRNQENFIGSQILAIDIDNKVGDRKKTKQEGYYSLLDAFKDPRVSECASFVYTTPSHTSKHHRFRIVYLLPNFMNDKEKFSKLVKSMNQAFGDDPATKSICQPFYGSKDSKVKYFGKLLPPDEVDNLVEAYDEKINNSDIKQLNSEGLDSSKFNLEDIKDILMYIFINGKLDNNEWWKVPTTLKNCFNLDDDTIVNLISKYTEVGDTKDKLKHAAKYKGYFSAGTLIWLAQKNGYEIPNHLRGQRFKRKFWSLKPIENKEGTITAYKYSTDDYGYQKFLESEGFCNYLSDGQPELVRVRDNIIYSASEVEVRNFTLKYLEDDANLYSESMVSSTVKSGFRRDSNRLVPNTIKNLDHLNDRDGFKFLKDNLKKTHIFYLNGFRKIEPQKEDFIEYKDMNGFILDTQIVNRDYNESDGQTSIIEQFLRNISTTRTDEGELIFKQDKFNSFKSIIGYLTNKYKQKDLAKAIILCDPNIPDSEESEGGVGKSLFAKILSYVGNQTVVDGRNFQKNNEFNLNHLDASCDVCLINDFADSDFSNFYNYITDDLQIRQLYKGTQVIKFEDAPKFIFTMNKVLTGTGSSDTRRKVEIELSNFYNLEHKPSDDFGILFDWDEAEWARFDAFISKCVKFFYNNGLVECKPVNLDYNRFVSNTSSQFAAYAKHYIKPDTIYWMDSIFVDYSDKSSEILSPHYQTKYLNAFAKFSGTYKYDEYLKSQSNRRFIVFSTEKSKNITYWKQTPEFQKLITSVSTRPSQVREKTQTRVTRSMVQ